MCAERPHFRVCSLYGATNIKQRKNHHKLISFAGIEPELIVVTLCDKLSALTVSTYFMSLDRRECKMQLDWCTEKYSSEALVLVSILISF